MEKKEVIERVNAYLERVRESGNLYPLDKVGLWEANNWGPIGNRTGPIYHGSFLEVVATAVQNRNFCLRGSGENSTKYLFGKINEAEIKELANNFTPSDLEEKVVS